MRVLFLAVTTAIVLAATMISPGLTQGGGASIIPSFAAPGPTRTVEQDRTQRRARLDQRARRLQARRASRATRSHHHAVSP